MKWMLWLIGLLVLLGMPVIGAAEEPCQARGVVGGLACVDAEGETRWEIHHPSLWDTVEEYLAGAEGQTPVGPVTVGDRSFYGVRGDLLEVDLEAGRVLGRSRLMATITGLEASEGTLKVALGFRPEWPRDAEAVALEMVLALDGPIRSQSIWHGDTIDARFAAHRDAHWLIEKLDEVDESRRLVRLARAYEADPTNLFLLQKLTTDFLGVLEDPEVAWREALSPSFSVPWQDLIRVSWELESDAASRELAGDVFEQGYADMIAAGVEPERITNLVTFVLLHMHDNETVREQMRDGDLQSVSDLVDRMARTAPLIEAGELVWFPFAEWLESEGVDAALWHERAEYNREHGKTLAGASAESADRLIALIAGLTVALVLSSLAIGVISGRRRRQAAVARPQEAQPWWRPSVRPREIMGLVLLLGALQLASMGLSAQIMVIGDMSQAPLGVFDDTLGAPGLDTWFDERGRFGGQALFQELREIAEQDREAALRGDAVSGKERVSDLLYEGLLADARGYQWEMLKSAKATNPFALAGTLGDYGDEEMLSIFLWVPFLLLLVGLMFIGALFGGLITPVGTWYLRLLPGAAEGLAPFGPLLMGGALAAVAAFLGADSILTSLAQPDFFRYYGLDEMPYVFEVRPDRRWAAALLTVAVAAQAVAVVREVRQSREIK